MRSRNGSESPGLGLGSGWNGVGDADLVVGGGGELQAFWAGNRTTDTFDPLFGLNLATSTDGGGSWTLTPASIYTKFFAYGRTPSVAVLNGVSIQTWYYIGEPAVHVGLDPNPDVALYSPPGTNENIAADPGSGQVWIAWCNGLEPQPGVGVWAQQVDPGSGSGMGSAVRMPGSPTSFEGAERHLCPAASRTPFVARAGGGFFAATSAGYPGRDRVLVWRVGSGQPAVVVKKGSGGDPDYEVGLAADGSGRLWVAWVVFDSQGSPVLYVRRSNRAAAVWGEAVAVKPPSKQIDFQNIDLAAQGDRLDVLKSLRTNAKGVASIDLPAGTYKAVDSKAGYVSASTRVKAT